MNVFPVSLEQRASNQQEEPGNQPPGVSERQPGDQPRLYITWSDGEQRVYSLARLQASCPCATCNEKRRATPRATSTSVGVQLPVITGQETQPLRLQSMRPVGNYAYALQFNHGCDRGIYTFELLRQLGEPVTQ